MLFKSQSNSLQRHTKSFLLYLRIEQSSSDWKGSGWGIRYSEIGVIMSSHQCPKEVILVSTFFDCQVMDSTMTQSSSCHVRPSYNPPGKLGAVTSCWNTRVTLHCEVVDPGTANLWVIPCQINAKKILTLIDLNETWFLHSVCWDINPQWISAFCNVWLQS